MSAYRESPPDMPEPPRRGAWVESCPHGFLAKWQWACQECAGRNQRTVLDVPSWVPILVWSGVILAIVCGIRH